MAIYKYGKGRNRWRVVIHHPKLLKGRREWIVRGSKEHAEEREARERLELKVQEQRVNQAAPTFLAFCVNQYRPNAELRLRKSTWYNRQFLIASLGSFFGATKLDEIRNADVDAFVRKRMADGLSEVSINN